MELGSGVYGSTLVVFSGLLLGLFFRHRKQGWAIAKEGEMALDARASREAAVRSEAALVRIEAQGALAGLALARVEATLAALVK